ncbi:1-phosphatidylinositol-4-phosphate 5-kinase [Sugiyamaella lignohabitans]|uniref:1-phosphatidylinositol-4-phosphate 5-kinase n=1 Tax=Sugiyamaella lignohabitans TaxID=796027 RepID=A0A167D8F7_9ASCO|nr:1-phosphatidylinositol-4-phosphate 5-kinase [Sugiyamaella lignohabitans]ANB12609.1 1-phosphatidylinositol-4-phosphate 5-kinase [Sugiyamaella lignohabitans]
MGIRRLYRKCRHHLKRDESVVANYHSVNDGGVESKPMPTDNLRIRQTCSVEDIRSSYPNCQAFLTKYGSKHQAHKDRSHIGIIENPRYAYPNCEKLAYYSKHGAHGKISQVDSTIRLNIDNSMGYDSGKAPYSRTGSIDSKETLTTDNFGLEQTDYEEYIAKEISSGRGTKNIIVPNSEVEMDSIVSAEADNLHRIWSTPTQVSLDIVVNHGGNILCEVAPIASNYHSDDSSCKESSNMAIREEPSDISTTQTVLIEENLTTDKQISLPVKPVRPRVCPFLLQPEIDEMIANEREGSVSSSVCNSSQSIVSDTYDLPTAISGNILQDATCEYPPRFGSVDAALNPKFVKFDEDKKTMLMKRAEAKIDSFKRKLGLKSSPIAPKKYLIFLGIYSSLVENPPIVHPEVRVQFFQPGHKTFKVSPDAVVQCHFPSVYENIRTLCGSYFPYYLNSFLFDHDALHEKSPGKTDADFYFTADRKYIIKTIQRKEHNTLMGESFMRDYYSHIQENPDTLIPTYLGHFTLRTLGKDTHFVVMKNLLDTDVNMVYDLKGIKHRNRSGVSSVINDLDINKDGDWLENQEVILMGKGKRDKFLIQLASDVALLEKYNIMDYSLLVGIHSDPQSGKVRHSMGMIDSLSPYGLSKALKSNFSRIVHRPSSLNTINPRDYGKRFLNFIGSTVVLECGGPMLY